MANNNNTKNLNVPNLRFPEFSGEWEMSSIGEQFELYSGNTPSRMNKNQFDGSINWITSGELKEHYISDTKEKISEEAAKNNSLKLLPVGTFVIAIYGLEANGVRGTCSITTRESTISQACMAFTSKMDIQNEFLYSWYKKHGNIIGIKYAQGTKQQNLSYDIIERFNISYPCMEEQKKLIRFISLIDQRIATQNKIIEDLKKLKSAVITVIFTTTNGVNYQLKDLAKFIGGGTPSSNDSSYWSGDIPWISSSDVSEDNINKITITRHITNEAIKKSATQICESPCILIVSRVGVGKVALSNISLCTSQDFCNLTKIKCNPKFLAYQLQSIMKRKSYAVQGTSIKGITTEEIKKTGIMLPSIEKQLSIASTLSRIDTFIDVEISILENYQKLRKYLLQQMFI